MANTTHSLVTYVSDMLAVEQHLQRAFDIQRDDADFKEFQDVSDILLRLTALCERHVNDLNATLADIGGHEAASLKNAVGEIEGAIAGVIDKMRKTKISKGLRDDYAALAFAIACYTELLTTANGMSSPTVAAIAQRHLGDYASMIMDIGECVPNVTLRELRDLELDVDAASGERTVEDIRNAWRTRAETTR